MGERYDAIYVEKIGKAVPVLKKLTQISRLPPPIDGAVHVKPGSTAVPCPYGQGPPSGAADDDIYA